MSTHVSRACTGVMSAIDETMGCMLLRIVEQAPGVGVFASFCRVAGKRPRRPGAMMRLEPQSIIAFLFGHTQQSGGERAGGATSTGHIGCLPYPIERIKPLLRRAAALCEIERPHVGKFCGDRAFGG